MSDESQTTTAPDKRELRTVLRKRREAVLDREGRSRAIQHALLAWEPCRLAERLLVYVNHGTEVGTELLRAEKPCAMPVVVGKLGLKFCTGALVPGCLGIPEPTGPEVTPGPGDVLVVPLIGFDSEMNRIGQGGGYYDVLIQRLRVEQPEIRIVGLGFLVQLLDRIPTEPHDQRLDAVATEAGIWEY